MKTILHFLGLALIISPALDAAAATNTFLRPDFRFGPNTTFVQWENFTVGIGDPGNAGDLSLANDNIRLFQLAPGAQVLGSGNIYNGAEASLFELRYSGDAPVDIALFQVRTLGTELDYGSVELIASTDTGPQSLFAPRLELEREVFGPPPPNPGSGSSVTSLWQWDLGGLDAREFVIHFDAVEINLSLDSAVLDVHLIPEPSPVALVALGACLLAFTRRTRG
jgi:hypothetical protein